MPPALHGPTGRPHRKRLSPDERRHQLLAIGVDRLTTQPLEAISVEDIAAAAGVSPGLVFHYFGTRQGLHLAIVRTARDAMLAATQPDPALPARERLRDVLARFVTFVQQHDATFHSVVRGAASGDPRVRETVQHARDVLTEHTTAVVVDLGAQRTPLVDVAVRAWISLAEQALVDAATDTAIPSAELVAFLERSALAVVAAAAPTTTTPDTPRGPDAV